jgi:2,3-bisphosphoglycerate-independent phosphoglycerate mutase
MKQINLKNSKKVILLILDGWGIGKDDASNPIWVAQPKFFNSLCKKYPYTTLCASNSCVGVPSNQVGNSEAGHQNIGAGRVVDQDSVKILKCINTGEFFKNPAFMAAINHAKNNNSAIHLMGLLSSDQSPHSNPDHLLALLTLIRRYKIKKIYLHLFTDGRDSPPRSALKAVSALERFLKPNELIATLTGRFYAMDRKKAWERTIRAYNAMVFNQVEHKAKSPQAGITEAYNADITDEFIEPIVLYKKGRMIRRISNNDAVIFFNLRSDRARQLAKPFAQKDFEKNNPGSDKYKRKKVLKNIVFVAMTDFGPDLDGILTAFPSEDIKNTLPLVLEDIKQAYIAEKEKYAHVTYFFNGGYSEPIDGEEWFLIPSPKVDHYDETPAMSTGKIINKTISLLPKYDFICVNIACPDMIGHTGNFEAGVAAIKAVDVNIKKLYQAVLKNKATLIITADHGNVEEMLNLETGEKITEHTCNPVPFVLVDNKLKNLKLKKEGVLGDIAPTIVKLFNIKKPKEFKRRSLF